MAAFSSLALAAGLGALGGALFSRKKKKKEGDLVTAPAPTTPTQTPAEQVQATQPVAAPKAESDNQKTAAGVAVRTRRRGAAGNSGPRLGGSGGRGTYAGTPRSLLGS